MPSSSDSAPRRTWIRRLRRTKLTIPDWAYGLLTVLVLLWLWETAVDHAWVNAYRFPPPSKLARTFEALLERGFPRGVTTDIHFKATLWRILKGYTAATVFAIPLGLIRGHAAAGARGDAHHHLRPLGGNAQPVAAGRGLVRRG